MDTQDTQIKLNIGGGDYEIPGYINVDRKFGGEAYPVTLPGGKRVAEGTVDEIRASHVLEHFSHRDTAKVLQHWVSLLKLDGLLKISVPDFDWIVKSYASGRGGLPYEGFLMGGHCDENDKHHAIFNRDKLLTMMELAGLKDVDTWTSEIGDCANMSLSLNLRGWKRKPTPKMKIRAAMSVPRLGFQSNFFCWAQGLAPYNILPTKYDGAFWGQCLERVLSDMTESVDGILCIDYDTVFGPEQVGKLLDAFSDHPEIDAFAPIQIRRTGGTPLLTINDAKGVPLKEIDADVFRRPLVKVDTAHFGLTLIRASSLKNLPHPWFMGVPAPDGTWGEGRVDDDIYFWRHWAKHGRNVYVVPRICVGHSIESVIWPGKDFSVLHQEPKDFYVSGPPAGVWR